MSVTMTDNPAGAKPVRRNEVQEASYRAGVEAQQRGDYRLARALYTRVLDKDARHAGALHWLGVLDFLDGKAEAALKQINKAIGFGPVSSEMYDNQGTVLQHLGRAEESLLAYKRAIELDATNVHALINLASSLSKYEQNDTAVALARKALALRPDHAGAHNVLGHVALKQKQFETALTHFQTTLAATPRDPESHYNVGVALQDQRRYAEALDYYENAIAINNKPAKYYVNRGAALLKLMRIEEAAESYQQALARDNNLAEAHYNLSICELLKGNFIEGFAHYEWRLRVGAPAGMSPPRAVEGPRWEGQAAPDKTLLLVSEQGLGDSVQFIRFAALAARRVGRVVVEVQPRLKPLFQSIPDIEVFAAGEKLPAHDFHAPLMSLPHLLGITLEQLPAAPTPYLQVDDARIAKWHAIMSAKPGVRVGIRWQGNPNAKVDFGRSIALKMLAPLAAIPGVRLISLQKDEGADQMNDPALGFTVETVEDQDKSGSADTLLDTAAIIANLDLVISTDTMIAHLAAALGRPTWVMLKPDADWRWLRERADCPWHPTMRLFRGKTDSGWPKVIDDVAAALAQSVKKTAPTAPATPAPIAAEEVAEAPAPAHAATPEAAAAPAPVAAEPAGERINRQLLRAVQIHQAGQVTQAAEMYRSILAQAPEEATALHYLGVIAYQEGRLDEAEGLIGRAKAYAPNNPEIHSNYALVLKHLGRLQEAVVACETALSLRPGYAEAESNYGNILSELGQYEAAMPHYRAAVAAQPNRSEFHSNLGRNLKECGQLDEAEKVLRVCVQQRPDHAEAHFDLAEVLLATGQFAEGWAEYEWRRKTAAYGQISALSQPEWNGEPAPGKVLMLHAEQGLGDTFQFARFVQLAKAQVGRVLVVVQPNIKSLMARLVGADAVFAYGEPLPQFDLRAPLPSLPYLLKLHSEAQLGMNAPYLSPSPAAAEIWRAQLADQPGLRVGLVWQGNPAARVDKGRSLPLALLAPLAEVAGVRFIRLQRGEAARQVAQLGPEFNIETPLPEMPTATSFGEDAALIAGLDLVITTDTSVAHLAGALGKPVWLMAKFTPDWRWQLQRNDSYWYAGHMRLFRQSQRGEWGSVVAAMKAALAELAAKPLPKMELSPEPEVVPEPIAEVVAEAAPQPAPVPQPAPAQDTARLDRALALHQAGNLVEAAKLYDEILDTDQNHIAALHYRGVVAYQQDDAVLGEVLIRQALAHKPDYLEAVGNLGLTLKAQGKLDEAIAVYRQALQLNPDFAEAHNNLGNMLAGLKQFDQALKHHQAAASLQPMRAENHNSLGNTLGDLERYIEAERAFNQALALQPQNVNAMNGLAKVLHKSERLSECEAIYRRVLEITPDKPEAWSNLGVVLREQGRYDEALASYDRALQLNPQHTDTWGNRAFALHHLDRIDEAEAAYRRVLETKPDNAEAHFGVGAALLARGDYKAGWPEYRWRKKLKDFGPTRPLNGTEWQGQLLPGKTLFLYAEQGLGDTVQWARFLKLAAARVGKLVVEVQKSLVPLIQTAEETATIIPQGAELPPYDVHLALMDLPGVLDITLDNLPSQTPYLFPDSLRNKLWYHRMSEKPGLRVGLNWQGNPKGAIDKGRSLPLALLAPLAEVPDVRLISLQKEKAAEQIKTCGFGVEAVEDPEAFGPGPMSDTVALMMNLDLIITTDTSIAHIAGALGRPTWVLLKKGCEWRWMLDRADTPWYPNMQLFRQTENGQWEDVITRVKAELLKIVS